MSNLSYNCIIYIKIGPDRIQNHTEKLLCKNFKHKKLLLELHVHQTTQLITARGAVMQRKSFKWAMTKNSLHCYWTFSWSFSLKMKLLQSHCPVSCNYWPKKQWVESLYSGVPLLICELICMRVHARFCMCCPVRSLLRPSMIVSALGHE